MLHGGHSQLQMVMSLNNFGIVKIHNDAIGLVDKCGDVVSGDVTSVKNVTTGKKLDSRSYRLGSQVL